MKTSGARHDDSRSDPPLFARDSMATDPRLIPAPMTHLVPVSADLLPRDCASHASDASACDSACKSRG